MRAVVFHDTYGCESGCCGHVINIDGIRQKFSFDHPATGEDFRKFAERLLAEEFGAEHILDLDWEQCVIVDD